MAKSILPILIRKELIQFRRNKFLPKLLVMMPIMLVLVMPLVTQMDVKNVSVALLDSDRSSLSMRMESHLANSDYFRLQTTTSSYDDAIQRLDQGKIDIIISVPEHFERDLRSGHPKPILLTANGVNATKGGQGMQYAVQTIVSAIKEYSITYSEASYSPSGRPVGGTPSSSLVTIQNRYNPTGNYRHFMLPALMVTLLLLVSCFLPLLNIITEKEHGTIEQMNVTPVRRIEFILAKLIPYWVIGLVLLGFSMLLAWAVYGLTPAGNPVLLFLASFLYSLCLSGFAVSIANVSSTMQQGIFVMFFFVMIFILMSGLFTPIESMPQWAQYITVAFPPRHVINVFRAVYLKGTLLSELRFEFIMLTLLAIGFNALATITYKKQN